MINGVITCSCGQLFGFETVNEKVMCPTCGVEFNAADYEIQQPAPEETTTEVIGDATSI